MDNNETRGLSTQQMKAIASLMLEPSAEEAAAAIGTGRTTIYRWLRDPDFLAELRLAETAAVDAASRRLASLSNQALAVIAGIMMDEAINASVRLRAAVSWLEQMVRIREATQLELRVAAIEASIKQAKEENEL